MQFASFTAVATIFLLALCPLRAAEKLTPLAPSPKWAQLEQFQETITRLEFQRLFQEVYAPDGASPGTIRIGADQVEILENAGTGRYFTLRFAPEIGPSRPIPRYWSPPEDIPAPRDPAKPLDGVKIALDPGHLGGRWAKMEERWFQIGESVPVTEGDLTLIVAKHLAVRLRELGATVAFTRSLPGPTTTDRLADFWKVGRRFLEERGVSPIRDRYAGPDDPLRENSVQWQAEKLFYRVSEIRHRADLVNRRIKPDLTVCLHLNAEAWGNPLAPVLVEENHLHVLVNGCYSPAEIGFDDVRFDLLFKLLDRSFATALPVSEKVAGALAEATGLPPYRYTGNNARRVGNSPYVWARNLLANRLFRCPVIYAEPYVMNSQVIFDRVQMGDYEGEQMVEGTMRKSIHREYADAVAEGIADFYRTARP